MTGTMLTWMQDREADGLIFIGPRGAAKSAAAKATGNSAGIPTIAFDRGAMRSSLVGGLGERLRAALEVVEAVSQGRELRRRFTLGTQLNVRFLFTAPAMAITLVSAAIRPPRWLAKLLRAVPLSNLL